MTVIVYRGCVMAGDSCWSEDSGLISNVQNKLLRLSSGALYGAAGAVDDRALIKLLRNARTHEQLPEARTLADDIYASLECLLVLPDRSVWQIEGGPKGYGVSPVSIPFTAIGSGAQVAMGALEHGATAVEAVHAACKWHTTCRKPVHSLPLKEQN